MSIDKTVIKIPQVIFTQYYPNVTNNIQEFVYNEGIYIKKSSVSATYPKSVVRIYKNKNNPKKLYLLSKDTTIFEAVAKKYANSDKLEEDITRNWPSLDTYLSYDSESYPKYSNFKQPSNFISLDINSLRGKTINFYSLTTSSYESILSVLERGLSRSRDGVSDSLTDSGVIVGSETIEEVTAPSSVAGSYIMKSKSILSDFAKQPFSFTEKQLNIFNGSLYAYWFDKGATINDVKLLSENDIELFKTATINYVDTFDFNSYVEFTYENLWIQNIDEDADGSGSQISDVINNYVFVKLEDPDDIYTDADEILINMVGKYCLITKNDTLLAENYKNRELFIANSQIRPGDEYYESVYGYTKITKRTPEFDDAGNITGYTNTNYKRFSAIGRSNKEIFFEKYTLSFNDYNVSDLDSSEIAEKKSLIFLAHEDDRKVQYSNLGQYSDLGQKNDLSKMYIFNDDIAEQWDKYGFIPDDPSLTIYELELDKDIDVENGTFMVVEIE